MLDYLKQNQIQAANQIETLEQLDYHLKQLHSQLSQLVNDQFYLEQSQDLISEALVAINQNDLKQIKALNDAINKQIEANQK